MATAPRHRLVTRSDFDGLVCAVLLKELDLIDEVVFVHPKDMQDGAVEITGRDITTNLPYVAGASMAFDHHSSETERVGAGRPNHVIDAGAPSAARVVYEHFGGAERFPRVSPELVAAVDRADSAQYALDDGVDPKGRALLNFLMDARTGLGRFRHFRVPTYALMIELIDYCRDHSVDEILALPDVAERVEVYRGHAPAFRAQLRRRSDVRGKVVVLDMRGEEVIHAGNRFMVYAINPTSALSVHVLWGKGQQNTVLAVGKSIFDRSSKADVGALMLRYGGGGHAAAGTCQVPHADADRVLDEVVDALNAAG